MSDERTFDPDNPPTLRELIDGTHETVQEIRKLNASHDFDRAVSVIVEQVRSTLRTYSPSARDEIAALTLQALMIDLADALDSHKLPQLLRIAISRYCAAIICASDELLQNPVLA